MLNGLQAASHLLIRASLVLFTGVVLLLNQSAWSASVSSWVQAIILATALLSYFRPQYGLFALALLAPLGQFGSRTLGSQMRGAEALVLAFLAGLLLRGWTLGKLRAFPANRLETAGAIFGLIIVASCAEQIWFMQIQRDFPWPFAQELLGYASRSYFTSYRGFGTIFNAMLLLEGIALLLHVARCTRERPQFGERLMVAIVAGAAAAAALTVWFVAAELVGTGQVQSRVWAFLSVHRWTVHVSDVNAAGSFFAMAMFIALGMALGRNTHRPAWLAAALLLAGTTWMTHSRSALAGVLITLASVAAAKTAGRILGVGKTIALTVAAMVCLMVGSWYYLGPEYFGRGAQAAVRVRWLFLGTTWRMLTSEPLFGVGVGQYFLWSHHFSSPELMAYYQNENAHNNFAQVAGELGMTGLAGFAAVLGLSLWHRREDWQSSAILVPVALGLAAFMVSCLGGHPLLVPEVAYPFWLTLGIAAALAPTWGRLDLSGQQDKHLRPFIFRTAVGLAAVLLCISLPFRVGAKSAQLDLSRVTYGLSSRQLMTSHARLFLPAAESRVHLPLRARSASDEEPVEIDVLVDGVASQSVTLSDRNWRRVRLDLPETTGGRFRQIDLRIMRDAPETASPAQSSVEVGTWEIIAKPNG
jgi:hypothetical protein